MGYAPVNNTIVFIGTKENIVDFLNIGLNTSHLPAIDGKDYRGFIDFLMRNARHYEVDRSICAGSYHANGLTMGTFCTDAYMNTAVSDYNFNVRYGCDFDAEINSMCAKTINGYYSLELTVETNNCPPELWVKNIKEKVGFTYAFIHAADYDGNCFNYFKEIDDAEDHEYKEKHFEIEANAEDDDEKDDMLDALNEKIQDCFANYIFEKTKN